MAQVAPLLEWYTIDELFEAYDEWLWNMRQLYKKPEGVDDVVREWTKEMKHDKHMVYVFRAKEREAKDKLKQVQKLVDNKVTRMIQSGDLTGDDLGTYIEHVRHSERIAKAEVSRWDYLARMAGGRVNNTQEIDFDELKQEVRIEELIGIDRKTLGRSQVCCPIHNEKTPSCVVYHDQNSFYCYGCHAGGSVIDFVMARDGVPIKEAVKLLTGMC